MSATTTIMSVSIPTALTKAIDALAVSTHQNRSELVRSALREYIVDATAQRERFVKAYKETRKIPLRELKASEVGAALAAQAKKARNTKKSELVNLH